MTGAALARRAGGVVLAVALAVVARSTAVHGLPVDYDELVYLPAGYWYAARMSPGRWGELPAEPANREHPPLAKLLYGLEIRRGGLPEPDRSQVHPGALPPEAARPAFLLADPALWPDPIGRLWASVTFHFRHAGSEHVTSLSLPWWQPLAWLSRAEPATWHPGVFLVSFPDRVLLLAAALSAGVAWRRRPVWVVWSAMGLLFLLAWPTKWPQYTLLIRPGLAGCAGLGLSALWRGLIRFRAGTAMARLRAPG